MTGTSSRCDPARVAAFAEIFFGVADEMGRALVRSAFSVNIKERLDCSCAVFTGDGTMVAQADHIPVHLGSAPLSVRAILQSFRPQPGDEFLLNDPFAGGTHLPDVTLARPVFLEGRSRPAFFVLNRAHHADIGGAEAGSMGIHPDVYGEGFRIPPVRLARGGRVDGEVLALFRAQVRRPEERIGDLMAQRAANDVGERRLADLAARHGAATLDRMARALVDRTGRAVAALVARIPPGVFRATDELDDDGTGSGPVRIVAAVRRSRGRLRFDFRGSSRQTAGPVNANRAVTLAACAYVLRALIDEDVAQNEGILRAIELRTEPGSVVDARPPAAVAGGNVETSQRIVDTVLRALAEPLPDRVPAASAGTMSNLVLSGPSFCHYQTLAGGAGAGPRRPGAHAIQTHMTNTRNTSIETLEREAPLRVERLAVRRGSGGRGARPGGDGQIFEARALAPLAGTLLADRERRPPWGLRGGGPGRRFRAEKVTAAGRRQRLPAKGSFALGRGERLVIRTPGGGGHGGRR